MQDRDEIRSPTGHVVRVEDDVLSIEFRGPLSVADAEVLSAAYERTLQRFGYLLMLADIREADSASPEARRELVLWAKPHGSRISAAAYGGSLVVRSFMKLMNGAVRILSDKQPSLEFFRTEAEARQFLTQERTRLQHRTLG